MIIGINDLVGRRDLSCWQLTQTVMNRLGKFMPSWDDFIDKICSNDLESSIKSLFCPIDKPQAYCIICIRSKKDFVNSIGIVMPECKSFLHVCQTRGVVIENIKDWSGHIEGYCVLR